MAIKVVKSIVSMSCGNQHMLTSWIRVFAIVSLVSVLGAVASGKIEVAVHDIKSNGPLRASILLKGPITVGDFTDIDGVVAFRALVPGRYTIIIRRPGYETVEETVHLQRGSTDRVNVHLAKKDDLKTIATVVVRASNPSGRSILNSNNPLTILSRNLSGALYRLPSLNVGTGPLFSPNDISIDGHDPSSTSVYIDGVPVNFPGGAFNIGSLDADVLNSASISYAASTRGAGGTLDFHTLTPTAVWQSHVDANSASYGRSFTSLSEQGTIGRLGVAFEHSFRSDSSPLDGVKFHDASGLDYVHAGNVIDRGDMVNLRYDSGGGHDVSFTSIDSTRYADALCTLDTTFLPCGYGPGNYTTGVSDLRKLSVEFSLARRLWRATAFKYKVSSNLDFGRQVFQGIALPLNAGAKSTIEGELLHGDMSLGSNDNVTLDAGLLNQVQSGQSLSGGISSAFSDALHETTVSLDEMHRLGPRITFATRGKLIALSGTNGGLAAQETVLIRNSPVATTTVSALMGREINADGTANLLSAPGELQFNCAYKTALGVAPGDSISTGSVHAFDVTWDDALPRGELTIQAFEEADRHRSLTALVSAAAFPSSLFPNNYFAQVQGLYQLGANCGSSNVLVPRSLYLATPVSDVDTVSSGGRIEAEFPLTRTIVFSGDLALTRVAAWSTDPRLSNPLSIFREGSQVQGIPLVSAYFSLGYSPTDKAFPHILAGAQYIGYGNEQFLPPYVVMDAAIIKPLRRGTISLGVDNLFNSHAGSFVTNQGAIPMLTGGGVQIGAGAIPNPPRTFTLSYTVGIGRYARARSPINDSFGGLSSTSTTILPGYLFVKWPLTAPSDPFRHNSGTACNHTNSMIAQRIMLPLQRYVNDLAVFGRAHGFPSASPFRAPKLPGVRIIYERVGTTYALTIRTTEVSIARSLLSCQYIHVGVAENARASGLPYPSRPELTAVRLYYSPVAGIYFIQVPFKNNEEQKFRLYGVPIRARRHPFALHARNCDVRLYPIARRLLTQLRRYFLNGKPASGRTRDWKIVYHRTAGGGWYELVTDKIGADTSLINCARVASTTYVDLRARGLGGVSPPSFNFSKSLGLYIIAGQNPRRL